MYLYATLYFSRASARKIMRTGRSTQTAEWACLRCSKPLFNRTFFLQICRCFDFQNHQNYRTCYLDINPRYYPNWQNGHAWNVPCQCITGFFSSNLLVFSFAESPESQNLLSRSSAWDPRYYPIRQDDPNRQNGHAQDVPYHYVTVFFYFKSACFDLQSPELQICRGFCSPWVSKRN